MAGWGQFLIASRIVTATEVLGVHDAGSSCAKWLNDRGLGVKPTQIVNGDKTEPHKLQWGTAEKMITAILGIMGTLITYGAISTATTSAANNAMLQRVIAKQESDEEKLERVVRAVEEHVAWAGGRSVTMDELQRRIEALERAKGGR